MNILKRAKKVRFEELFDSMTTKSELVAAFVAILELIRDGHMTADERGGELICRGCDDFDGYEENSSDA